MAKKNLMIYVDEKVARKAKELGLNISKVCENCLKDMIGRIEDSNPQAMTKGAKWCGRRDSNPGRQRGRLMS